MEIQFVRGVVHSIYERRGRLRPKDRPLMSVSMVCKRVLCMCIKYQKIYAGSSIELKIAPIQLFVSIWLDFFITQTGFKILPDSHHKRCHFPLLSTLLWYKQTVEDPICLSLDCYYQAAQLITLVGWNNDRYLTYAHLQEKKLFLLLH